MNIFEKISKEIEIKSDTKYIKGTPEFLLKYVANILSYKLKKKIRIDVYEKFEDPISESSRVDLKIGMDFNLSTLSDLGFSKVNRVWNENEFSILGDVVIFFPKGEGSVVRLSLFDNIIEKISFLDNQTRRVIKDVGSYTFANTSQNTSSVFLSDTEFIDLKIFNTYRHWNDFDGDFIDIGLRAFPEIGGLNTEKIIDSYIKQGFSVYFSGEKCPNFEAIKVLEEHFDRGFVLANQKIVLITDFEVLGKLDLNDFDSDGGGEKIFKEVVKGDYIVHQDHGIGIYESIVNQNGVLYMDIHYAGNDRLLIPMSAAGKLTKYIGAGRSVPILTGLSSGVWGRVKGRVNEDVHRIAAELIRLYAMRNVSKTTALIQSADDISDLMDFVSKFKYQDTEDQTVITNQLVEDMSISKPMDRLIVGDVGFGKTELAARAAFIAMNAGSQVAILAPTTVLSAQHYKVLVDRFKDYPFKIAVLNRFTTGSQREKTIDDIKRGKIDLVIGTHSILSESVIFKNLGLLIVDEEQKFGVAQKEALKKKRVDINVLSITATPIPRTLNMAISGIRDLSVLSSVPSGRKPISNHFGKFDWDIVIEAINKEVARGGQIYFLNNRIRNLNELAGEIVTKVPGIRVGVAHGQMGEKQLSKVMMDFGDGNIDVLVCSSIIENGLDFPNVNTVIIKDAQRYGLSSLYQIRGRVGRSEREAYAYILYENLKGKANMRIDALSEANNIGSGFILSSRDLEIRGAGNILGKSQSGAINSVGYALYTQMLKDAITKLQDKQYKQILI